VAEPEAPSIFIMNGSHVVVTSIFMKYLLGMTLEFEVPSTVAIDDVIESSIVSLSA